MKYVIIGTVVLVQKVRRGVEADSIEEAMEVAHEEEGHGKYWERDLLSTKFKVDGIFKKGDEEKFEGLFRKKKINLDNLETVDEINEEYDLKETDGK